MADTTVPPGVAEPLQHLIDATRDVGVATIVSAIVAAMSRPVSVGEVLEMQRDIRFALYPAPGFRVYAEWEKSKGAALTKLRN